MDEQKIEDFIKTASNKKEVLSLLKHLFTQQNRERENAISNKNFFDRYFSLSLLPNEISTVEFEESIIQQNSSEKLLALNQKNSSLLRILLNNKLKGYQISKRDELENLFEKLFQLYESVLLPKTLIDLYEGVNTTDLQALIIGLYKRATIAQEEKEKVFENLTMRERESYVHLSLLLNLDAIFFMTDNLNERKNVFLKFRDWQKEYLKRSIATNDYIKVFKIIQQARRYISMTSNKYSQDDTLWFTKNILQENKEYINNNLPNFLQYIRDSVTMDNGQEDKELGKEMIQSIFHDISNVDIFNVAGINDDAEGLLDYYYGFNTLENNFMFCQQPPPNPNFQDYNDHIYPNNEKPQVFDLRVCNAVKILITPLETEYWRLGFRFSETNTFPLIMNNAEYHRHLPAFPYINLATGNPKGETSGEWFNEKNLYLDDYTVNDSKLIFQDYLNERLIFQFDFDERDKKIIFTIKRADKEEKIVPQNWNSRLQFFTIAAWCDNRDYKIMTKIKIKNVAPLQ